MATWDSKRSSRNPHSCSSLSRLTHGCQLASRHSAPYYITHSLSAHSPRSKQRVAARTREAYSRGNGVNYQSTFILASNTSQSDRHSVVFTCETHSIMERGSEVAFSTLERGWQGGPDVLTWATILPVNKSLPTPHTLTFDWRGRGLFPG